MATSSVLYSPLTPEPRLRRPPTIQQQASHLETSPALLLGRDSTCKNDKSQLGDKTSTRMYSPPVVLISWHTNDSGGVLHSSS